MREKSLTKNSIYNVIYKSLNVVFPLVTSMYVSRVLLSDGVGRVASAKNLVTYFTLLAALGLPTYGTKKIAELRNEPNLLSKTFSELYLINLISTTICTICYFSIVLSVNTYKSDFMLYAIVGLQVVLNVFNIDWFYQGIEEYGYIMIRSLVVKIISFIFIIIFVRGQSDYLYYALASVLGIAFNYIMNVIHLRKIIRFTFKGLNLKRHIKYLLILFSTGIAVEIYTLSDITMLTIMTDKNCVGYYSNAINGVKTIKEMIVAICAVFLPRLSFHYAQGEKETFRNLANKGIKILLFFSIPAAVGCFILADKMVLLLFGKGFVKAILTVRILAMSIITVGLSNYIGYQILIIIGKEKMMLYISSFGAVLNIVMNYFLISLLQHNGAATASMLTEVIVCCFYICAYNKYMGFQWLPKYVFRIVISTLLMSISINFIMLINFTIIISCLISVCVGVCIYLISSLILKNEIAVLLWNKGLNKL